MFLPWCRTGYCPIDGVCSFHLVDVMDVGEVVEALVELVEHVNDLHGLHGGRDVGERHDVAEQDRRRRELL